MLLVRSLPLVTTFHRWIIEIVFLDPLYVEPDSICPSHYLVTSFLPRTPGGSMAAIQGHFANCNGLSIQRDVVSSEKSPNLLLDPLGVPSPPTFPPKNKDSAAHGSSKTVPSPHVRGRPWRLPIHSPLFLSLLTILGCTHK